MNTYQNQRFGNANNCRRRGGHAGEMESWVKWDEMKMNPREEDDTKNC